MTTDQLITAIVADSGMQMPFDHLFRRARAAGIAVAGLIFFSVIGPRPDFALALDTWRFLLKFLITVPLAVIASSMVLLMGKPNKWSENRTALLLVPVNLLLVTALLELFLLPRSLWMERLVGSNSANCMTLIPLLATMPLAAFLIALRHGASVDPGKAGAAAGLAAAAIAASFYALNCFDDSPLFVITWYPLATFVVVGFGYLLGRRILRW
jgi:hypothetical protein